MTSSNQHGRASHIGQLIGEAFENVVFKFIKYYLKREHPEFTILNPELGRKLLTLDMPGGVKRQLDTVIAHTESDDPIALLETKWLKDGRHWSDKGAWILQLREVRKNYPTVRGAAAVLAGHWNEGVRVLLRNQGGGINMLLVATDEEIYQSLQPSLDQYLGKNSFSLNAKQIRFRFPEKRVEEFDDFLISLRESGQLYKLAKTWLSFDRVLETGETFKGKTLIQKGLDDLLKPLPKQLMISNFEVTFEVETGNLIHKTFQDLEELLDFINQTARNPEKIREIISPKKRGKKIGEQIGFYDTEDDDEDW
ncbi:MAG: hypothetical protein IT314_13620 [Anaerolineales bacterium]|nr:hypothetical protein [Anaerolineales bacterium]